MSPAGQQLDLINIMAYDAGNKASTGETGSVAVLRSTDASMMQVSVQATVCSPH
jgi:hypothetical protein